MKGQSRMKDGKEKLQKERRETDNIVDNTKRKMEGK
jgi:hypothetical protein